VAGITISLKSFMTNTEKSLIAVYNDLVKECGYAIRARPDLYTNLKKFLTQCNDDFKRILGLFGGAVSPYQITDIGFSHMIEYCIRLNLPETDSATKALCFGVFQIHDAKNIRKGGALEKFRAACEALKDWAEEGNEGVGSNPTSGKFFVYIFFFKIFTQLILYYYTLRLKYL